MSLAQQTLDIIHQIPEDKWCTGKSFDMKSGQACFLGHMCEHRSGAKIYNYALVSDLTDMAAHLGMNVAEVNDYQTKLYNQPTPKGRIEAFLNYAIKQGL